MTQSRHLFGLAALLVALLGPVRGMCQSTLRITQEEISESGIFNRYVVTAGKVEFSIIQPPGWGVSHSAEGKSLLLRAPKGGGSLKAQWKPEDDLPPEARKDVAAWVVSSQFNQATVMDKQPCHGMGIDGTAVTIRHLVGERQFFVSRVGLFSLNGGCLLATYTVPESGGKQLDMEWVGLVNSLELKMVPEGAGGK